MMVEDTLYGSQWAATAKLNEMALLCHSLAEGGLPNIPHPTACTVTVSGRGFHTVLAGMLPECGTADRIYFDQ